ncbi:hypothetical protein HMPREF1093_00439 [Hungatella hathewayi 12489931]|uniref:substrate-binding domain-containing protein n=1 Tax=Hungatella hathewayi TaxID=154046 RepID=UPI0002D1C33B|nr:substrate-binding domain-containing protein [Hungatella hathewayi]ENY99229.1 hypothetical protein HMPREF1093_00439 [Hungatella hathewayi 12489931]
MKRKWMAAAAAVLILLAAGVWWLYTERGRGQIEQVDYVIGVSQANMRETWRLALISEIEDAAAEYPNIRLIMTDATSDGEKQKKDVERLMQFDIDLLIISPGDAREMTDVIGQVYQKIPVIVMDRGVEGFDYTLFIGPDNELIGRQAGEGAAKRLAEKGGTVFEVCGSENSISSAERSKGFDLVLSREPGIVREQFRVEQESRDQAEDLFLELGQRLAGVDVVFAHNDYMASGVYEAVKKLGYSPEIIGVDGFSGPNGGMDLVRQGKLSETITCPTGGKEAIRYAMDILNEVSGVPKQVILRSHNITIDNVDSEVKWEQYKKKDRNTIQVGYSQVGTESAWRLANTESIKSAAREAGISLHFEDADQQQERQIEAIRTFIREEVDVIVLSPVVDSGWDEVLTEAREAGIPVLLSDRRIETEDDGLYLTYIGADFMEEGRRAMRWIAANVKTEHGAVKIMELQGTLGASPTVERKRGFEEQMAGNPGYRIAGNPGYRIAYSESGDFTYEGGRRIIEDYIENYPWDIDVIYAHNDDMALGAVNALEEHGIHAGSDVVIVSVDGTKDAFQAMIDGKLNCAVECNPLLGPQLMKAVQDLMEGKELPLRIITEEKVYDQTDAREVMKERRY